MKDINDIQKKKQLTTDKIKYEDINNENFIKSIKKEIEEKEKYKEKEKENEDIKKEKIKKKEKLFNLYGKAYVDGVEYLLDNYKIEPPTIFMGRGDHPYIGRIKTRIYPEDITINTSDVNKLAPLPEHLKNNKWGEIINDNKVEWLSSWVDPI